MFKKLYFILSCILVVQLSVEAKPKYPTENLNKITIFWDTSLSMKDKDVTKELALLDAYFYKTPNVTVELIVFSNSIDLQKTFAIINSDWTILKEELLKTTYDGVAFFDVLLEKQESDINLLFTDGHEVINKLILNKTTPTHVITSTKKSNAIILMEQSRLSKGNFIDLTEVSIKEGLLLLNVEGTNIVDVKVKRTTPKKK